MEIVEDERDLGGVEDGCRRIEAARVTQVREQFAAADVFEDHVQTTVVALSAQSASHIIKMGHSRAQKTRNISETVQDRTKVTITD